MTNQAFVNALRGPEDTPAEINPLSYLRTAIVTLQDLDTAIAERDEDPDGIDAMITELFVLHRNLTAALTAHDAGQPDPDAMRCAVCGWTVDTSQPPAKPTVKLRGRPEISPTPEALAATETLANLDF
jgi:hypothetical protein